MYSGSLDLFRLNPRPKIFIAKTSFKPNTRNFPEISTTPTQKPSKNNSVPRPSAFLQHSCGRFRPRDLKRLSSLTVSTAFSNLPWDLTMFFYGFSHPPPVFATPKGHLLGHLVALDHPVATNGKSKGHGVLCWFWRTFCHQGFANCEVAALGDLRLQSVPPTSLNSTSSQFLYPCLHRILFCDRSSWGTTPRQKSTVQGV